MNDSDPRSGGDDRFATTRWGLVATAREGGSPEADAALAELFRAYWYPIYAYIRRRGHPAGSAEDLTQAFFAAWLERDTLRSVSPDKGRFRSFLLASCKHFLINERQRDGALKRGGGHAPVSLDLRDAEGRYAVEPSYDMTAERLFERRWAITLLERVLGRLGDEQAKAGKSPLFERLRPALLGTGESASHARVASDLGMTEGAVKVAAHRLRRRYRELLLEEVASTVADPEDVDGEIRDLFTALGG